MVDGDVQEQPALCTPEVLRMSHDLDSAPRPNVDELPSSRPATLDEVLRIGLSHTATLRSLGAQVLSNPNAGDTSLEPLLQYSDPVFGEQAALAAFQHCELRRGAKNLVFADGNPAARVMVIGEAPGRDEDIAGKPFVGRAGQLLDKMLDAIGMARAAENAAKSVYITNILPWRPPQNRDPLPDEIAMMLPFVERHVELVKPDVLILMGNISCLALLGRKGITRLRGNWVEALGKPALPMFHPAYLLRNPAAKREAWPDLLMLQDRLTDMCCWLIRLCCSPLSRPRLR